MGLAGLCWRRPLAGGLATGGVCVCLIFLSRCMQRLFSSPLHGQIPSPTTVGYTGASLSPTASSDGQRKVER